MTFGPASRLGVERFESTPLQQQYQATNNEERENLLSAAYRQVLGNSYVMDSERQIVAESQFKLGRISMREFVRTLAKSYLYRSRFFDSCNRYRYIELTFKHLLGRSPDSFAEMREHAHRLDSEGYDADINSFIDSDEYQQKFGEDTVPYLHGWKSGPGKSMREFTWMFQLTRGAGSSDLKGDLSGIEFKLGRAAYLNRPLPVVAPSGVNGNGQGFGFRPTTRATEPQSRLGVGASDEGKVFRVEITGYSAPGVAKTSRYRKSNRVVYVPFAKLSEQFQRIHRERGKIASITPVS
ncbi:MAG: phycobilisome linker polypeptide [Cyanobacteria bacterium MAG CAR1_bin_15]|nr:phycobilisome linker polypeptide [Cyanobacteria bacterium MAG CAR1_bin_15]